MTLLTKKDFAAKTGQTTKTLSTYILRGKVKAEPNGLIDSTLEVNKSFMIIHSGKEVKVKKGKVAVVQVSREETYSEPGFEDDEDNEDSDVPPLHVSEKIYKHWQAVKTQRSAELAQIDIDKKNGIVVPSELIKPLFLQHNQSIMTEFRNMMDEELRAVAKTFDIPINKVAEIKGRWMESLNSAIRRAAEVSVKAVSGIIEDYSVKKGK